MQFALPSLLTMIAAVAVAFYVVPKFAPVVLAGISVALIILVSYNHYLLFKEEYANMTWVQYARSYAPYLLVSVVLLFIFGFLLLLVGRGASKLAMPPGAIPPPETATNFMTEAIGNGLNRIGLANIQKNYVRPEPNENRSLLSISPSLEKNVGESTLQSALESRLAKAV